MRVKTMVSCFHSFFSQEAVERRSDERRGSSIPSRRFRPVKSAARSNASPPNLPTSNPGACPSPLVMFVSEPLGRNASHAATAFKVPQGSTPGKTSITQLPNTASRPTTPSSNQRKNAPVIRPGREPLGPLGGWFLPLRFSQPLETSTPAFGHATKRVIRRSRFLRCLG